MMEAVSKGIVVRSQSGWQVLSVMAAYRGGREERWASLPVQKMLRELWEWSTVGGINRSDYVVAYIN